MSFDWTDAKIEKAKQLWADGFSATQIADEMGGTLSRSAVMGKINRLGITRRNRVNFQEPVKRIRHVERRAEKMQKPVVATPPKPPRIAPAVISDAHKMHFMQAEYHHCHWPLWGDNAAFEDKFYCGSPTANVLEGRPYCAAHSAMARGASIPRTESPSHTWKWQRAS